MRGNILYIDNDVTFLDTRAMFLERAGYTVYKAHTIAEAEAILERHWIQLLLIDNRLDDDDNPEDSTGLKFAARIDIRAIPKLIITGYPNFDDMRKVISKLGGESLIFDYLDKVQPPMEMVEVVDQVFKKIEDANGSAKITWHNLFPNQLLFRLANKDENLHFKEGISELEMVFRSAFRNLYRELVITLLPTQSVSLQHFIIHAFPEHVQPVTFAGYCSIIPGSSVIEAIIKNFKAAYPEETNQVQAITRRFALFAHPLEYSENDLSFFTFRNLFAQYDARTIAQGLQRLQQRRLKKLHGRAKWCDISLIDMFKELTWDNLLIKKKLIDSMAAHVGLDLWSLPNEPTMYTGWEQVRNELQRNFLCGVIHGNLRGDTIIFDSAGKVWVIDFSAISTETPLLLEYVRLECNLRAEWSSDLRYEEWLAFDRALLEETEIPDNEFPNTERLRKQVAVLGTLRNLAHQESQCDSIGYKQALILCLAEQIIAFKGNHTLLPSELKPYLSSLISLYNLLPVIHDEVIPSNPVLYFDKSRNLLFIDNDEIELTSGEADLFDFFLGRRNMLVNRGDISRDLYGVKLNDMHEDDVEYIEAQRVNTMVMRLRKRLNAHPLMPKDLIKTIRGKGYLLAWPEGG